MHDDSNFMKADEPIHMTKMKDSQTIDISSQKKVEATNPSLGLGSPGAKSSITEESISEEPGSPEMRADLASPKPVSKETQPESTKEESDHKPVDITEGQL